MAEYIEREAAYEDFDKCNSENPKWTPSRVKALIARQKAADVSPVRHGKWSEWFPGDCALIMTGEEMLYRCSSCNAKYPDVEGYKHCPNCGAKMDLEV